jgi:hypothetical protein
MPVPNNLEEELVNMRHRYLNDRPAMHEEVQPQPGKKKEWGGIRGFFKKFSRKN